MHTKDRKEPHHAKDSDSLDPTTYHTARNAEALHRQEDQADAGDVDAEAGTQGALPTKRWHSTSPTHHMPRTEEADVSKAPVGQGCTERLRPTNREAFLLPPHVTTPQALHPTSPSHARDIQQPYTSSTLRQSSRRTARPTPNACNPRPHRTPAYLCTTQGQRPTSS